MLDQDWHTHTAAHGSLGIDGPRLSLHHTANPKIWNQKAFRTAACDHGCGGTHHKQLGANARVSAASEIVRLNIKLDSVKATVMRRIDVPVDISLDLLHEIIQTVMPWGSRNKTRGADLIQIDAPHEGLRGPADFVAAVNLSAFRGT